MAVGIGASTAMFSVMNAVLLRPLPYANAERLSVICSDMHVRNVKNFPFSPPDFDDLRKETTGAFEDMAALWTFRQAVTVPGSEPEVVAAGGVTPNFFHLMGAHIDLGRDFEEEDATPELLPPNLQPGVAPPPKLRFWRFSAKATGNVAMAATGVSWAGTSTSVRLARR